MQRVLRAQTDFTDTTLRNQLTSLILYEAITTSRLNGKKLVSYADRFFNKVRLQDLKAHKLAHATLLNKNAIRKVFEDILTRYEAKDTNFVRSLSSTPRRGDNAAQLAVMLIKEAKIDSKSKQIVASSETKAVDQATDKTVKTKATTTEKTK